MANDALDLFDLATDLLDISVRALDLLPDLDADLLGAPERQYVAPGTVNLAEMDCPSVIVNANASGDETTQPLNPLPAGDMRQVHGRVNMETLSILIIRCCEVNAGPAPADVWTREAKQTMCDRRQVGEAIYWSLYNGILKDRCSFFRNDGGRAYGPDGGFVGSIITCRFHLDGFRVDLGSA